jgi:Transcription factor WhiB
MCVNADGRAKSTSRLGCKRCWITGVPSPSKSLQCRPEYPWRRPWRLYGPLRAPEGSARPLGAECQACSFGPVVAAIELSVDIEQLMRPGVDVLDARDILRVLLHRPAWHADAACSGSGPSPWFPTRGEPTEPAKAVCAACPVRLECLEFALAHDDLAGVWGGTSRQQRDVARRRGLDAETLIAEFGT